MEANIEVKLTVNTKDFKRASKEAIERALEEIGMKGENYAKLNLYPGHGFDTGHLQGSITHDKEGLTVIVGTNVEYAPYVELGTSKRSPITFLAPAIEEHIPEYQDILEKHLKNG